MLPAHIIRSVVTATAHEVLHELGLAYLVDDDETIWAATRSTRCPGLQALLAGQRVKLTLDHHPSFSVVHNYDPQS